MLSREPNGAEVYSCTSSPDCAWRVPLLIVPATVTVDPGRATCGFIASMVTETRPAAARGVLAWAVLACAGPAAASPAVAIAAGMADAAARARSRRLTLTGSKP